MPRSNWRQPRGRGGLIPRNRSQQASDIVASPSPPVGELIEVISEGSILDEYAKSSSRPAITGTKLIASYNWLDERAKIIIPGTHILSE